METLKKMQKHLTSGFTSMNEESLILVMGGASEQLSATGSCGSTGSSIGCDNTAVCNCCVFIPTEKPKVV